jgi:phospholipase C
MTAKDKSLHDRAFYINKNDPEFYELTTLKYDDNGMQREINVPKGDVLYQFRKDVESGQLPTVSWLVAPENYSDHPSSAWFGAWYLSECMDILTKNPEVWKKTVFILTYDENDGYYDHQPPFVAPDPRNPLTGKTSASINPSVEFITMDQEKELSGFDKRYWRESSIGLGYRVPMVVASPWSRGGWVNSEVFDHTSSLRFLEKFLQKKTGKHIPEPNISSWRKAVCGDLTSVFRTTKDDEAKEPTAVQKDAFIQSVHQAKFKGAPSAYKRLDATAIEAIKSGKLRDALPVQEPGTRPSCALPYEINVNGKLSKDGKHFELTMESASKRFGKAAAGAPFTVYVPGEFNGESLHNRSYAVAAGEKLTDSFDLEGFTGKKYHVKVYGPNGFYREFKAGGPALTVNYERNRLNSQLLTGNIVVASDREIEIADLSYGNKAIVSRATNTVIDLVKSQGWYHLGIREIGKEDYTAIFAGRVETGKHSISDPAMAGGTV